MEIKNHPCIEEVLEKYDFRKPLQKKKQFVIPQWLLLCKYIFFITVLPILGAYLFVSVFISGFNIYNWVDIEWHLFIYISLVVIYFCRFIDTYSESIAMDLERDMYLRDQALKKKYGM